MSDTASRSAAGTAGRLASADVTHEKGGTSTKASRAKAGAMMAGWLERRLDAQVEGLRDGEAESLAQGAREAPATPLQPLGGPARSEVSPDPARARHDVIEAALAEKVLRSHLHNNLQISFPLVLNLANQSGAETALLMEIAAEAVLSDGGAARRTRTAEILRSVGADAEALARFEAALADPRPLSCVLAAVAEARLGAHAYAVALVVAPRPSAAQGAFFDYLAARLELGADVVSGVSRRYRR